ncbi:menaquinone biosynthetic enzyme MqnA/MqnD family protein [Paenibacillus sp. GCM10012307]|uniref:Chorismate dehydratase n=1 Tax=Paenibacillus roseus TaxID=2798579 RepID=A0A934J8G7_9BACL|nr:menaquinone biosynthesis protein [Paenibacillus roseus]MBJ6363528.1 menaquinone biosynthesis protein [Paenibacillus roseus]
METSRPFRLGRIDYANAWPIFHYFGDMGGVEVVSELPSSLNQALFAEELDMSAISSFSYAQNADNYLILPDLSVSSPRRVNSILLFLKKPLEHVLRGKIAVTNTSATSVNLLKMIMKRYYEASPAYVTQPPSLEAMLADSDAALLIGDHAIKASWENSRYEVLDLGELWRNWTGYGMTFALVAVRKSAALAAPATLARVYQALWESKQRSLVNLEPLVRKACTLIGGTADYWYRYFTELNYDFGPAQQAGLQLYFNLANELELLPHKVEMEYWTNPSAVQVNE